LPAPLKVHLSEEEDQELLAFQKINGIPLRVRETAEIIRLNHHGWTIAAIAKSQQKSLHTGRLNILGLYSVGVSFDYGLKLGSFKGDTYVKLLDWQAQKTAKRLAETGQITVSLARKRLISFSTTQVFISDEPD
jgi:hypothetical protein